MSFLAVESLQESLIKTVLQLQLSEADVVLCYMDDEEPLNMLTFR